MTEKPKNEKDLKITDLPKAKIDDAKVKGGMPPRKITYTGDEVDTQTGD